MMRWVLIFWVFLMGAVSYLDRVNISIAQKWIQSDFGINDIQMGYVFAAFSLGYALFQAPGGRLADKYGPRIVIGIGVVWWSLFTVFTAWVPVGLSISLMLLVLTRFVLGVGEAVVYPASNQLVSKWIPTKERGLANGLIFAGVGAGAGVTPVLITWIIMNWGWHWSFYISAIIGLVTGIGWYLLARDTPRTHPWVKKRELEFIQAGLTVKASADKPAAAPWGRILHNRSLWLVTISYFAYGYTAWIFFTWFFKYVNEVRGLNLKDSAFYGSLPFLAMAICSPLGGTISDILTRRMGKWVGRCGVGVVGMGGAAICIAFGTQTESAQLCSIALACGVGLQYLSQSSFWSVTADIAGRSAGTVSGVMNMGGQLGGFLTGILTPRIAAYFGGSAGWTASFLTPAILCAIGAICWAFVNPNSRIESE
jgi:MFS transporter, ACS family, glucarate transporter